MATAAQIAANRRNAQRSTGPRSPDGKRRVALNAVTHGLDCRAVLLPDEDRAEFERYRNAMIADHAPAGAAEQDCVERMVAAHWRIVRAWRAEADIHAQARQRLGFDADPGTAMLFDQQHEKGFAYVDRKEAALAREYDRCSRRLIELQRLRRQGERPEIADDAEEASGTQTQPDASAPVDWASGDSAEQTQPGATGAPTAEDAQVAAALLPSNDGTPAEIAEQSQSAEPPQRAAA